LSDRVDPPRIGTPAPELALPTINGDEVRLENLRGRPVLVVFLRHAGCLFCRTHLEKLLKRRERIEALGAEFLAIVHDEPGRGGAGGVVPEELPERPCVASLMVSRP